MGNLHMLSLWSAWQIWLSFRHRNDRGSCLRFIRLWLWNYGLWIVEILRIWIETRPLSHGKYLEILAIWQVTALQFFWRGSIICIVSLVLIGWKGFVCLLQYNCCRCFLPIIVRVFSAVEFRTCTSLTVLSTLTDRTICTLWIGVSRSWRHSLPYHYIVGNVTRRWYVGTGLFISCKFCG